MNINFKNVTAVTIPEGKVIEIKNDEGVLWKAEQGKDYFVPDLFVFTMPEELKYGSAIAANFKLSYKNANETIKAALELTLKTYDADTEELIDEKTLSATNKNAVLRGRSSTILFGTSIFTDTDSGDLNVGKYRFDAIAQDENGRYSAPLSRFLSVTE